MASALRGRTFKAVFLTLFMLHFGFGALSRGAETPSFTEITRHAAPGVALIAGYMGQQTQEPYVEASGFFVHQSGLLVSVSNVFTNPENRRLCERFTVRLFDGRQVQAKMRSVDPILNLILFQVTKPGQYLTVDTDFRGRVRPGDKVIALSGVRDSADATGTSGYVKARHRKSLYGAGLGDMFIDSHMRLPPLAYGGPLLNEHGKVIGINTPNVHRPDTESADPDETHALPMLVVNGFFKMAKIYPSAGQNWLGLAFRPLTPDEKTKVYKTLGHRSGIVVDFVWAEGPAGQSQIQTGDILFSLNGTPLADLHQLTKDLLDAEVGSPAKLALLRRDRGFFKQVTLEKRPAWAGYVNWRRNNLTDTRTRTRARVVGH